MLSLGSRTLVSKRFSESGVSCSSRVVNRALTGCFLGHPSTLWSFNPQYRQRLLSIWSLRSLPFNLPSLPSLSERSTRGVDGDGDLTMEDGCLEGFWELRDGAVCGRVVDDWGRDEAELCEEAEY